METIDGVEIASSYKEYLDLALGDLEDRLKKGTLKLNDFKERIVKRTNLLKEIEMELERRKDLAIQLSEKDKFLRTRLIRNTEMKSQLQNLADIAGYKLTSLDKKKEIYSNSVPTLELMDTNSTLIQKQDLIPSSSFSSSSSLTLGEDEELTLIKNKNLSDSLVDKWEKSKNSSTYTRYIEMAYAEVDSILTHDKQTLIDVIRQVKTNEFKLKELEQLKIKANASLSRLIELESNLSNVINHDTQIATTLKMLEKQMLKFNTENVSKLNAGSNA